MAIQPQPKMTIFSWVLSTLAINQEAVDAPSHSISPLMRRRSLVHLSTPYG